MLVSRFELYHFEVQLGSQTLLHSSFSPLEQIRTVSGVFIHPHYDPINLHNDIALLMVQKPFDYFNQWTSPACLPRPDFNVSFGTNCIVVDKYPQCKHHFEFLLITIFKIIFKCWFLNLPSRSFNRSGSAIGCLPNGQTPPFNNLCWS